jgi:hypothetical protein
VNFDDRTPFPRRRLATAVVALIALTACGGDAPETADDAAASRSATPGVLGTIEATIDGEARTWYVVEGTARTGAYASAAWIDAGDDGRIVSIGGYDDERPPIETFEADMQSGSLSFGDYDGSAFVVSVTVSGDGGPFSVELGGSSNAMVAYMPQASADMSGMYTSASGALDVTSSSFDAETSRVSGTFSGTLRQMQGDGEIPIENGRFDVDGIPAVETLGGGP